MRKFFAVVLFLISGLSLIAHDQTGNDRCGYTLSNSVSSKYYGSILGGVFYDQPLVYVDLLTSCTDKIGATYVDLWVSRPITNLGYNQNGGDEYDLSIGRTFNIKNTKGQAEVRLDVSGTYFVIHPLARMNAHVFTVAARADFPQVPIVQPYAAWYYFGKVGQNSPPAGEFFYGGLIRNQPTKLSIRDRRVIANFDYRFGFSGGALGADWGPAYNRLSVGLALPATKSVTVTPAIVGQTPFTRRDPLKVLSDRSRVFLTLAVSYHWGK